MACVGWCGRFGWMAVSTKAVVSKEEHQQREVWVWLLSSYVISIQPSWYGGCIEEAFATCKKRNEAAFVTFVSSGFPAKEGEGNITT